MLLLHVALCFSTHPPVVRSLQPVSAILLHRRQLPPVKVSTQRRRVGPYRLRKDDPTNTMLYYTEWVRDIHEVHVFSFLNLSGFVAPPLRRVYA
jgi:hypothetical protein